MRIEKAEEPKLAEEASENGSTSLWAVMPAVVIVSTLFAVCCYYLLQWANN